MKNSKMNRREFLEKSSILAIGATAMAAGLISCNSPSPTNTSHQTVTLDISQPDNSALASVNGGVKISVNGVSNPVMVTRVSQTNVAAFSTKCTHQGCDVNLPASNGVISCPCHGSTFSIQGHVTGGPAQSNLTAYTATLSGNIVTITV